MSNWCGLLVIAYILSELKHTCSKVFRDVDDRTTMAAIVVKRIIAQLHRLQGHQARPQGVNNVNVFSNRSIAEV